MAEKAITQDRVEPTESLTLDEFCARLSKTDKRVELIGGFYADAKKCGQYKDVDVGFLRAFAEYADRPVN